ncbi:MAG: NAD(P)(+) transhydrogenase (Re/Si-specific) subunit beta [Lentisphaerae bacterium]|nr:NAD(P)(+) transhydrogenase (Re/Si-specific) subunit beta [Lentisphaerota bacterium]MBT4819240.1 NAD(P)(+) transhydrogenase (Re/Si-specific) subunit beta [Lentisphaerota bacterium]MBT5604998.1 NAD(P)(+) transhydrogenase (Re/Si-specific) subunit beta [Lentisphaerota bacterium]MBT7054628.1 NAD(P)(+) transhydrogenase (Re/Si-specific) subunit beta [Lentisphaerota bacterium]MBT7844657.1 NAD(P)(+) transhydrogenase (Re/Si-specific) subunit beta [Lentisphaerota bacterium]
MTPTHLAYIVSAALFAVGLKRMSSPATARQGNLLSAVGMLVAVVFTLARAGLDYRWIAVGVAAGSLVGIVTALKVQMTSMPEMVALFNGSGGLASLLVGWAEFNGQPGPHAVPFLVAVVLTILIGGVTFTGSVIAWGKLSGKVYSGPVTFPGQQVVNGVFLLAVVTLGVLFCVQFGGGGTWRLMGPNTYIYLFVFGAQLLGVMAVIAIGGADMPVVISLLNSYSGLAACAAGFVIDSSILVVAGAFVGASGLILTSIMCKAMNRSLANVLFGGFGVADSSSGGGTEQGEAQAASAQDAYYVLEAAQSIAFVPGYGMAAAQAQHAVRELGDLLEANGAEVQFAVHPVAGRMPGHMNVLLAEANVSYEKFIEMDDINPIIESVDVCVVIGANDVVNPAARDDASSSIYGMPIIEVDRARNVFVLKRSMASGFAGISNPLFYKANTKMIFGDAKATIETLVEEFKAS